MLNMTAGSIDSVRRHAMKISRENYRKMNKGYNAIFDGLQEIEDITPEVSMGVNQALNILDACLDEIKKSIVEEEAEQEKPSTQGFTVYSD